MATEVGRSLSEINKKVKELNSNINSVKRENKLLDKSLKFDTKPLDTLNKRFENNRRAITSITQKLTLLREKQKQYDTQLAKGEITQQKYDKLSRDITKAELDLKQLNAEQKKTNDLINKLPLQKYKELGSRVKDVGGKFEKVGNNLRGISMAAGGAIAGITGVGIAGVKSADDIQTISDQLNITAEEYQVLDNLARLTDVDADKMQKAFIKVRDALGTRMLGTVNEATKALDTLNVSISGEDTDVEQFYKIAIAISKVEDASKQAALANDIFGTRLGAELLPFINAGEEALRGYVKEIDNIGIFSNDAIQGLATFENEMQKLNLRTNKLKLEVAEGLLPIFEKFFDFLNTKLMPYLSDLNERFAKLPIGIQENIIGFTAFLAILSPLLIIIGKLIQSIGYIIPLIAKLKTVTTLAAGKWALLAVSIGAVFALFTNWKNLNGIQKVIGIMGALTAAALSAAIAIGAFHSAWSLGLAVAGITAGIAAVTAAVLKAKKTAETELKTGDIDLKTTGNIEIPQIPDYTKATKDRTPASSTTNNYNNATYNITVDNNAGDTADDLAEKINQALLIQYGAGV